MLTHDPDAVKLHGVVVEVLDLRNPPISRAVLEEVWEGREGPVELEIPSRESLGCFRNNDTPKSLRIKMWMWIFLLCHELNRTSTWVSQSRDSFTTTPGKSGQT